MSDTKIVEEYPPERRITMAIPFKEYLDIPQIPRAVWARFQETCEAVAKTGREVGIHQYRDDYGQYARDPDAAGQ
jgi:hypothetical protein